MATIEARGYVNRPEAKTFGGKACSKFTLSVKQKNKVSGQEVITRAFFNVIDWNHSEPPADGAFVTVKGYLNVREYEKDGVKKQSLDVNCQELEVSPPRDGASAANAAPEKDPWE